MTKKIILYIDLILELKLNTRLNFNYEVVFGPGKAPLARYSRL